MMSAWSPETAGMEYILPPTTLIVQPVESVPETTYSRCGMAVRALTAGVCVSLLAGCQVDLPFAKHDETLPGFSHLMDKRNHMLEDDALWRSTTLQITISAETSSGDYLPSLSTAATAFVFRSPLDGSLQIGTVAHAADHNVSEALDKAQQEEYCKTQTICAQVVPTPDTDVQVSDYVTYNQQLRLGDRDVAIDLTDLKQGKADFFPDSPGPASEYPDITQDSTDAFYAFQLAGTQLMTVQGLIDNGELVALDVVPAGATMDDFANDDVKWGGRKIDGTTYGAPIPALEWHFPNLYGWANTRVVGMHETNADGSMIAGKYGLARAIPSNVLPPEMVGPDGQIFEHTQMIFDGEELDVDAESATRRVNMARLSIDANTGRKLWESLPDGFVCAGYSGTPLLDTQNRVVGVVQGVEDSHEVHDPHYPQLNGYDCGTIINVLAP